MKCQFCGSIEAEEKVVTEEFEHKGRQIKIANYIVYDCPKCGETIADQRSLQATGVILKKFMGKNVSVDLEKSLRSGELSKQVIDALIYYEADIRCPGRIDQVDTEAGERQIGVFKDGEFSTDFDFWKTKKHQGKVGWVTLYRERLSEAELKELKDEFPDILIVDSYVFFFQAYETRPVERRFSFRESFTSSYITRIDRKAGRIGALRRWWHVQKVVGEKSCIDRDRPDIDLAGDGWKPVDLPDDGRKIDCWPWEK